MVAPHVTAERPAHWLRAASEQPTLAEGSGGRFVQWQAWRSAEDDGALVAGCVATPIPGWVEDMRPAVEARTTALSGAAGSKMTGTPIDARPQHDGTLTLRAANDLTGPAVGRARTFIGFDESHVFTCFVTCLMKESQRPSPGQANIECERTVSTARLEETRAPPSPGLALRAGTWAVHHPKPTAFFGFGIAALLGILAVVLRRRPRSRMEAPVAPRGR